MPFSTPRVASSKNPRDAQPPETGDGFEDISTEVCAPSDLADALDALEADAAFSSALGTDLVANFVFNKRAEWDRFIEAEGAFDARRFGIVK